MSLAERSGQRLFASTSPTASDDILVLASFSRDTEGSLPALFDADWNHQTLLRISAQDLLHLRWTQMHYLATPSASTSASVSAVGVSAEDRENWQWAPLPLRANSRQDGVFEEAFEGDVFRRRPAQSLFAPLVSEASLVFLPHSALSSLSSTSQSTSAGQWVAITLRVFETHLRLCRQTSTSTSTATSTATASTRGSGTPLWTCEEVLALPPHTLADSQLISYAAKLHPALMHTHLRGHLLASSNASSNTSSSQILVSFVSNALSDTSLLYRASHLRTYIPRFFLLSGAQKTREETIEGENKGLQRHSSPRHTNSNRNSNSNNNRRRSTRRARQLSRWS